MNGKYSVCAINGNGDINGKPTAVSTRLIFGKEAFTAHDRSI